MVSWLKGYLDYINIIAKRKLQGYGKQFHFQYDLASSNVGIAQYNIVQQLASAIWDITDLTTISKIENNKILFPSKQIWVF
jgi:hypothetical protein